MRLVIEAAPLIGRWSLSDVWRRDRATWPPAPDTLFSALVAAAAGLGWGEPTPPEDVTTSRFGSALAWLETLSPPEIDAKEEPGRVEGQTWYVPVGDDAGLDQARVRKARHHNSVGSDAAVRWAWRVDPAEALRWRPLLEEIAAGVTRIGSSRGPVLATVRLVDDAAWNPALVPLPGGRMALRGVYPGRLTDLERWFRAGERPYPGPAVAYSSPLDLPVVPAWGEMVVLRKRAGLALGIERSVDIAEAVRAALLAHLGDGAPEVLSGHAEGGAVSRRDHLAIVPMARIDDRYADGAVLGIALLPPRTLEEAAWIRLMTAVGRWMGAGGRLVIAGRTVWTLELAADEHRVSLDPARYRRPSRGWASASPVVFDRHPRGTGDRSLPAIVTDMCRKSGLPTPVHIRAGTEPSLQGARPSRMHGLGTRAYLPGRYIAHLEVGWDRPVPGPVLLGTGRHFGLGLMLPA